jgi:hypothetical protein
VVLSLDGVVTNVQSRKPFTSHTEEQLCIRRCRFDWWHCRVGDGGALWRSYTWRPYRHVDWTHTLWLMDHVEGASMWGCNWSCSSRGDYATNNPDSWRRCCVWSDHCIYYLCGWTVGIPS